MGPGLFTGAMTLGILIQTSSAFREVQGSFSLFLQNWTRITELRSIYRRLSEFEKAIKETENHRIYQLRSRGGMLTHTCIDLLKGQNELRYLDLSNNRLITDIASKKIAEYFPE